MKISFDILLFNKFQLYITIRYHSRNRLVKLTKSNKIRKIRNSLYSVVPEGMEYFTPPALLTAAKLTSDAVWGYRSALAFYG